MTSNAANISANIKLSQGYPEGFESPLASHGSVARHTLVVDQGHNGEAGTSRHRFSHALIHSTVTMISHTQSEQCAVGILDSSNAHMLVQAPSEGDPAKVLARAVQPIHSQFSISF